MNTTLSSYVLQLLNLIDTAYNAIKDRNTEACKAVDNLENNMEIYNIAYP